MRFGKRWSTDVSKLRIANCGWGFGEMRWAGWAEERHGMGLMDDEMGLLAGLGTVVCASLAGAELN